jgi:hypothetical protein
MITEAQIATSRFCNSRSESGEYDESEISKLRGEFWRWPVPVSSRYLLGGLIRAVAAANFTVPGHILGPALSNSVLVHDYLLPRYLGRCLT